MNKKKRSDLSENYPEEYLNTVMDNRKNLYFNKDNNKKKYKKVYKREMNNREFQIVTTAIWFLFIFGLCAWFNTMTPLWLLILWFICIV